MIVNNFQGYIEGRDITKIPVQNLVYPSKNVIVSKGKISTRGGIVNDGVANTGGTKIHSEFVWKDALGGVRPIRCTGQKVQVKYNSKWYTIYESLDSSVTRVFFATWVDNNGAIVKKRLVMSDGSPHLYVWNGAIADVASYSSNVIGVDGSDTLEQLGFDSAIHTTFGDSTTQFDITNTVDDTYRYTYDSTGTDPSISSSTLSIGDEVNIQAENFNASNKGKFTVTAVGANYFEVTNASGVAESNKTIGSGSIVRFVSQTIRVFSLDGDGDVDDTSDYTYDNDPQSGTDLTIEETPSEDPADGDVVMAMPVKFENEIGSNFDIDVVYSYKNHVIVANYNSVNIYFSHLETYDLATGFDFTMPSSGSRTALTPIFMRIDGNFTAMVARKNTLWISDADDWYKVVKSVEQNAYGLWVDVEKFETGDRKGALPMAVAKHKGDIIYISQDSNIQRITTVEVLGTDDIQLISDDVEALVQRLNLNDVRVYYIERAIYIICPNDSTMLILDLVEGYFQPPQILPIQCMSVIGGVKFGHHNAVDETYTLFSGRDDLDTPIEAVIAFGYQSGEHDFRYKRHTMLGVSCRLTGNTVVDVDQEWEEDGAKTETNFEIKGDTVTTYAVDDDVSWATHPYAERSWGGADFETTELKRAMVFSKFDAVSYFDYRPILTISGDENEFQLLGWYIDDKVSPRKIGNDLFISK